ncbi:hypothetical protein ACWDTI_15300 [Gordonia sp. NPDC003424]
MSHPNNPGQPGNPYDPTEGAGAAGQPQSGQPGYGVDPNAAYGSAPYGGGRPGDPYSPTEVAPSGNGDGQGYAPAGYPPYGYGPGGYGQQGPGQGYDPQTYGQQNYAQAGYPPPGYAPQNAWGQGRYPPAPQKNRRKLFLWLTGVAAVLVLALVVILIVVTTRDKGPGGSPQAAVQTYLDGLAAGDAKKALSVIRTPASATFLTDGVLKQQQNIAKITGINVREPDNNLGEYATVKATYVFGDRNADVDFTVKKSDGSWVIDNGAIAVDVENLRAPDPTLFGTDIGKETKVYVFPGPLVWGSKNANVEVTDKQAKDFPLGPTSSAYVSLDVGLSDKGKAAVSDAMNAYFDNCAGSTQPRASTDRPGCGQSIIYPATPGSVRWTKPTDLSNLDYRLDYEDSSKVTIYGTVQWSATFVPTYGSTNTATDTDFVSGQVDLGTSTPVFTPR